jgi:hypothetical protein
MTQAEMRPLEEEERAHFRAKGRRDATMLSMMPLIATALPRCLPLSHHNHLPSLQVLSPAPRQQVLSPLRKFRDQAMKLVLSP